MSSESFFSRSRIPLTTVFCAYVSSIFFSAFSDSSACCRDQTWPAMQIQPQHRNQSRRQQRLNPVNKETSEAYAKGQYSRRPIWIGRPFLGQTFSYSLQLAQRFRLPTKEYGICPYWRGCSHTRRSKRRRRSHLREPTARASKTPETVSRNIAPFFTPELKYETNRYCCAISIGCFDSKKDVTESKEKRCRLVCDRSS